MDILEHSEEGDMIKKSKGETISLGGNHQRIEKHRFA